MSKKRQLFAVITNWQLAIKHVVCINLELNVMLQQNLLVVNLQEQKNANVSLVITLLVLLQRMMHVSNSFVDMKDVQKFHNSFVLN